MYVHIKYTYTHLYTCIHTFIHIFKYKWIYIYICITENRHLDCPQPLQDLGLRFQVMMCMRFWARNLPFCFAFLQDLILSPQPLKPRWVKPCALRFGHLCIHLSRQSWKTLLVRVKLRTVMNTSLVNPSEAVSQPLCFLRELLVSLCVLRTKLIQEMECQTQAATSEVQRWCRLIRFRSPVGQGCSAVTVLVCSLQWQLNAQSKVFRHLRMRSES